MAAALAYPVILLGECHVVVVAALLLFVLPNFEEVFADMEVTPPASTRLLKLISAESRGRAWLWGGTVQD